MTDRPAAPRFDAHAFLERHGLWFVIVMTLVLAGVTAQKTFVHELWGDEFRTWRDGIEKPLGTVLSWQHNPDHAPGGHLLARAGDALFGPDRAWSLRLGSWLCGLASVGALWWMGRTLWSGVAGLTMALMFTVDPNVGHQMTQARMYAPLMLCATLAVTLAGSLILRPLRPARRVVGLGVAIAAGIWFHGQIFAVVIALLIVGVALACNRSWRRVGVTLLIALAIGGILGAQGIVKIVSRHDAEAVVAPDIHAAPLGQLKVAIQQLCGKTGFAALILATAILGLMTMWRRPQYRPFAILCGLIVAIALLNLFVAVRYRPIAHARYLTVLQPPLWLAMAVFLVELCKSPRFGKTLGSAGLVALAVLCFLGFKRQHEALHWESQAQIFARACRAARESMRPGDRLAIVSRLPYSWFARYYGLDVDDQLDDAVTLTPSVRLQRAARRNAGLDRGTIWMICVLPPAKWQYKGPIDDPAAAWAMVAAARSIPTEPLRPEFVRTKRWQASLFRFEGGGVEQRGWYLRDP